MIDLYGEFECVVDDKGRLKLPSHLLRSIGGFPPYKFVMNCGFEKCLMLYPEKVWDEIVKKVNTLNPFIAEERNFIRYFFKGLKNLNTDTSERILIPKNLLDYASIEKEVTLFGYMGRIEIWDRKAFSSQTQLEPTNFSELADKLLGSQTLKLGEMSHE